MSPDKVIQKAYKMASGDDEDVPTNDASYDKYLSILNDLQRDWANEILILPHERWASLESEASASITDSDEYVIENGTFVYSPLKFPELRVVTADGSVKYPKRVSLKAFFKTKDDEPVYALSGDGKTIHLKGFGEGALYFPYYKDVSEISKGQSDGIIVDEPNWLIYMLAAEIARTDIVQQGQYGNLVALASSVMESMKSRQRGLRISQMDPWGVKDD